MSRRYYLGVDVGTGSVRAGIFDAKGKRAGLGSHPIRLFRPREDFVEQSSNDIWSATGKAVRQALRNAKLAPAQIAGIGFDATCSLVLLDGKDRPVSVGPGGRREQNVIVWMDHRAIEQAARINQTRHDVLRYVGSVISPEMQTPKLLWLKERLPRSFEAAARFLDLADFMTYRATGDDTRSLCTTVCKWTYLGHEGGWSRDYFESIGLEALLEDGAVRIGRRVRPMGERVGLLTAKAARELGLATTTAVGVGIIDAHAGGLGLLGAALDGVAPTPETLEQRLALIGGTSTCHMAVSREPRFIPGIWGPYHSAMLPGLWLTEGGQSATGALIDHTIFSHARGVELAAEARKRKTTVYALLNRVVERLARGRGPAAELTRELHVLPDHHGNRSPRADPSSRGMVSGLKLTDSTESLAVLYLATVQALAHGTRDILDTMNSHGYRIDTLFASGGDTKNPLFVREHADVTGCRVALPREPEAVLLGAAVLGAVAAGEHGSLLEAMAAMNRISSVVEPQRGAVAAYHGKKHLVFQRLHQDQSAYRRLMQ